MPLTLDFLAYPIGPSSPTARAEREVWLSDHATSHAILPREATYPFVDLEAGECFTVPITGDADADRKVLGSLRASCSQLGHKYGRLFRVIVHIAYNVYEVHRIK